MAFEQQPESRLMEASEHGRIQNLIEMILERESVSQEVKEILEQLKGTDRDLSEVSVEELREIILKKLS